MFRITLITAIAFGAAGAYAQTLYYVDDSRDYLYSIDVNTLNVTPIGSLGVGGDFGDMAWDATTSTMYYIGGRGNDNLYTLNLNTGAATLVGNYGVDDMFTLAADNTGQLYAQSTNGSVYKINKTNGSASAIGSNQVYPGGYTWDSKNGRVVFMEAGGGNAYSVDRSNGSVTLIGASLGFINDNDIAYEAGSNQYYAMDWSGDFYRWDGAFSTRTHIGGGYAAVAACDFANVVPEPASVSVLGLGVLALLRRKRK